MKPMSNPKDFNYLKAPLEPGFRAIEAGANDFEPLTHTQNDDMPEGRAGA